MPRHAAADLVPILAAARALGLPLTGRSVECYVAATHKGWCHPHQVAMVLDLETNNCRCSHCEWGR
jgi:hypothetical protein